MERGNLDVLEVSEIGCFGILNNLITALGMVVCEEFVKLPCSVTVS